MARALKLFGWALTAHVVLALAAHAAAESLFPPGDVNADGTVNILDMIHVRSHLGEDPATADNWRCDVNQDQKINILDLIFLRNRLNTSSEDYAAFNELPRMKLSDYYAGESVSVAPGAPTYTLPLNLDMQVPNNHISTHLPSRSFQTPNQAASVWRSPGDVKLAAVLSIQHAACQFHPRS